jgi:AcrR family transcriptional regulator
VAAAAIPIYRLEMLEKRRSGRTASYHHGDLREALVRAGRTILEKDGLAALSLRRVARTAGVSPAAPYHHFPDKQALLDAIATQGFDALTAAMETRMAEETDPDARLDASGVGYVAFAVENPALFRLMFGGREQELSTDAALMKAGERAYAVLQAAAAATSPDGAASPLVCLRLWALVHGIAKLILEGGVRPADYGLTSGEALAVRLLRGGRQA